MADQITKPDMTDRAERLRARQRERMSARYTAVRRALERQDLTRWRRRVTAYGAAAAIISGAGAWYFFGIHNGIAGVLIGLGVGLLGGLLTSRLGGNLADIKALDETYALLLAGSPEDEVVALCAEVDRISATDPVAAALAWSEGLKRANREGKGRARQDRKASRAAARSAKKNRSKANR